MTADLRPPTSPCCRVAISSRRRPEGSGRYVIAPYEWRLLPGVGHFPHLEEPDLVLGEILRWAKS